MKWKLESFSPLVFQTIVRMWMLKVSKDLEQSKIILTCGIELIEYVAWTRWMGDCDGNSPWLVKASLLRRNDVPRICVYFINVT